MLTSHFVSNNIILLLITTISYAFAVTSLHDYPLTMPTGNYMIHAGLTDQDTGEKYHMREFISSGKTIVGAVMISTPNDTFNLYYNIKDPQRKDSYNRLLIHGTECSLYPLSYIEIHLPGIVKSLLNSLLTIGPSVLYRLDHSTIAWLATPNATVRGVTMRGATTRIEDILRVTYYYKSNLSPKEAIQSPSRINFTGSDLSYKKIKREEYVLDIYFQETDTTDEFAKIIKPDPGLGCPVYFEDKLPLPTISTNLVHMILVETVEGPTTAKTVSQIYANNKLKMVRLTTSILGITTEALYDYSLGIIYLFQDGGACTMQPATVMAPGIDPKTGHFSLAALFQLDKEYNYIGEVYFKHRTGSVVKAWETIQYDLETPTGKHDRTVITQYFAETANTNAFNGYLLVATIMNHYKYDTLGQNYKLVESTIRDYMDFRIAETESEFHDKFSLSECKSFTSDMTLNFQLGCSGTNCLKFGEDHVYLLKDRFKESIFLNYDISPTRAGPIDITFHTSSINIRIDFLDVPQFQSIYRKKYVYPTDETISSLTKFTAANEFDCFSRVAESYVDFDVALFCPKGKICGTLRGIENVKKDDKKGLACQMIEVPLRNLRRIGREIANKDLQDRLMRDSIYKKIVLTNGQAEAKIYNVVDIFDETHEKKDHSRELFHLLTKENTMDLKSGNVVVVPDTKTFGDCYRACVNSNELECRTLSFCTKADSTTCLVTSSFARNISIIKDRACAIYFINHLLEYKQISNRRYKIESIPSSEKWLDHCAESCILDENCLSFQTCGSTCTLHGVYTDDATEYNEECQIYIPNVADKYQATGQMLVANSFHTEYNLNIAQCAALCYSSEPCRSFNYCPKGRSQNSCLLTEYSVKDSGTQIINSSSNCFNYELIEPKSSTAKQLSPKSLKVSSGSAAFGIIVVFLVSGLIFGIGLTMAYTKINSLGLWNNRVSWRGQQFTWSRQTNEQQNES